MRIYRKPKPAYRIENLILVIVAACVMAAMFGACILGPLLSGEL